MASFQTVNPAQPNSEPAMYMAELHRLVSERHNPTATLNFVVRLIHARFQIDVCSVYLLEPDRAHLAQGVDVWLNNPRRPLEASGTSGQKVVFIGGLNLPVLDGWWAEAYDGRNGFGNGETHSNQELQDRRDAEALYSIRIAW